MRVAAAAAVLAAVLVAILAWLPLRELHIERLAAENALQALDRFAAAESAVHRDILSARAGLLRNYDAIVAEVGQMREAQERLAQLSRNDAALASAVSKLAAAVERCEELIERFKSSNALLQNSLSYFGLFSARLSGEGHSRVLVQQANRLATAMLSLTLDTSAAAVERVEQRLVEVSFDNLTPADAASATALLAHARMLRDLLPTTDRVVKALFATGTSAERDEIGATVVNRQRAAEQQAGVLWNALGALAVALAALLVLLGARLRSRALVLQRRRQFEHLIAGISTRFINSHPHETGLQIERALAELADCVQADRAYFIVPGAPGRSYRWCTAGGSWPAGWPENVLVMGARLGLAPHGIIQILDTAEMPPGPEAEALVAAQVAAWLGIGGMSGAQLTGLLAFDALRPQHACTSAEWGLLRMAFDVIANAVDREFLEAERDSLEASLNQARRMETIGALTSGIAHNFNNIVGAILGYSEMASAHTKPGSRIAAGLNEIRRAGERGRDLVEQILNFGRRSGAHRELVSLGELLGETKSLLDASLPPDMQLVVGARAEPATVSGEPAQLQQVILNICNNAAQAMPDGGTIAVSLDIREPLVPLRVGDDELGPGRYVVLSIEDTGRGMDEVTRERIFEPFFTTRVEGNGLGLATTREIVREHGGAIKAQSTLGVGTRFDVWLPAAMSAPAKGSSPSAPADRYWHGGGQTVLVIDADREFLLRHEEVLAALGYEPVGFTRHEDAAAACRQSPGRFDTALLCHVRGGVSGTQAATLLHAAAPDLPIVLATSAPGDVALAALSSAGVRELIHYPPASIELAGALSRSLSEHAPRPPGHGPPARAEDGPDPRRRDGGAQ